MADETKKVRLLVSFAGGWSGSVGDEVTRPADEADRLIAAGYATAVGATKRTPRRTATKRTRETAVAEE